MCKLGKTFRLLDCDQVFLQAVTVVPGLLCLKLWVAGRYPSSPTGSFPSAEGLKFAV